MMDFVSCLLRLSEEYDSIWVIVDRVNKSAYFLLVRKIDPVKKLAKLYLIEIVYLHDILVLMVSNQDDRFTSIFLKKVAIGFWYVSKV